MEALEENIVPLLRKRINARSIIAHGVWGICDDYPDALILAAHVRRRPRPGGSSCSGIGVTTTWLADYATCISALPIERSTKCTATLVGMSIIVLAPSSAM